MDIQKIDYPITVTKPYMPPMEDFYERVKGIWANRWLTNDGPYLKEFTSNLKKYLDCDHLSPTVNGHSALDIAMKCASVSGEVITTPFSFASTTHAISMNGAEPVFCDIDPETFTMDPECIEDLITDKTTALVPVHVYGIPCDVEKIQKIADKHNLKVIYDAAHTFGCRYKGKSLCTYGDMSILSFHATKLFHSIEGGALVYNDPELESLVQCYRNFGIEDEVTVDRVGGNAKMNEFQAAMGLTNLEHIHEIINERKDITAHYRERISEIDGIRFQVPESIDGTEYNYAYLPVLIDSEVYGMTRDGVYDRLKEYNVFSRRYFYPLISNFGCYSSLPRYELPVSENVSQSVLCLPIYNGLKSEEIDYICDVLQKIAVNRCRYRM